MVPICFQYCFNIFQYLFNIVQSCNFSIVFQYVSNIYQYSSNMPLVVKYCQIWAYDQKHNHFSKFGSIRSNNWKTWSYGVPGTFSGDILEFGWYQPLICGWGVPLWIWCLMGYTPKWWCLTCGYPIRQAHIIWLPRNFWLLGNGAYLEDCFFSCVAVAGPWPWLCAYLGYLGMISFIAPTGESLPWLRQSHEWTWMDTVVLWWFFQPLKWRKPDDKSWT